MNQKTIKLKLQQDIDDKYFHSLKIKWNTDITYDNNITIDNVTLTNKLNYIIMLHYLKEIIV